VGDRQKGTLAKLQAFTQKLRTSSQKQQQQQVAAGAASKAAAAAADKQQQQQQDKQHRSAAVLPRNTSDKGEAYTEAMLCCAVHVC
jgi:hypothetical protein